MSKLQTEIALSKLHSEYVALYHSVRELFQPQMGQFTWWTSTKPIIGAHFKVHVLGSKKNFSEKIETCQYMQKKEENVLMFFNLFGL